MGNKIAKNTICLWYDHDAEAAARFYAETFPDSSVAGLFLGNRRLGSELVGQLAGDDFLKRDIRE